MTVIGQPHWWGHMTRSLALIVLAFLLTGCGSQSAPSTAAGTPSNSASAPAATPSASASPDAEAIRATAGAAYAAAAKTANDARKKLNAKYPANLTLRQAHAFYAGAAKIEGVFIAAIRKIVVPPDTAGDMHTLIVRETTQQAILLEASKARSLADLDGMSHDLITDGRNASAAANQVARTSAWHRFSIEVPPSRSRSARRSG